MNNPINKKPDNEYIKSRIAAIRAELKESNELISKAEALIEVEGEQISEDDALVEENNESANTLENETFPERNKRVSYLKEETVRIKEMLFDLVSSPMDSSLKEDKNIALFIYLKVMKKDLREKYLAAMFTTLDYGRAPTSKPLSKELPAPKEPSPPSHKIPPAITLPPAGERTPIKPTTDLRISTTRIPPQVKAPVGAPERRRISEEKPTAISRAAEPPILEPLPPMKKGKLELPRPSVPTEKKKEEFFIADKRGEELLEIKDMGRGEAKIGEKSLADKHIPPPQLKSKLEPENLKKSLEKKKEKKISLKKRLKARASDYGVSVFELFLGGDAGRPGPVERIVAHSILLMKIIQTTIGLKFILLANAIDAVLDMLTGYVLKIYNTWKMLVTIKRRVERGIYKGQLKSMAEDLAISRLKLSRLFSFVGFDIEKSLNKISSPQDCEKIASQTFPLKLVLEIRGHLDQMKRDLCLLNIGEAFQFAKSTTIDFLISLIPNPIDFIGMWKDIFILAFIMKYSREEIQRMYIDMVLWYELTISLLKEKQKNEQNFETPLEECDLKLMDYESKMLERLSLKEAQIQDLKQMTEKNRLSLQRLIQVLCNPEQFINPCKWRRFDLIFEVKIGNKHPLYELELDRWLTGEVRRVLKEKGMKFDFMEKTLQIQEEREINAQYRAEKKLGLIR